MLASVLGGWLALRVILWQSPFPQVLPANIFSRAHRGQAIDGAAALSHAHVNRSLRSPTASPPVVPGPLDAANAGPLPPPWRSVAVSEGESSVRPQAAAVPSATQPSARRIVGQQLLLAAAFSHMDLPPEIAAYFEPPKPPEGRSSALATGLPAARPSAPMSGQSRWSGDGWLLLRRDSAGSLAAGEPAYGRSQAGAVLRYRLAPSSGHRPVAYARVNRALAGPAETELAVGLAARPLARAPVSVAGEVRVYDGPAGREVRPAAFAVTELPPAKLPLGLRGEAYAQAGYVGGRFATAFVDGQAKVDARVARLGRTGALRAGAGVWGGAQKHSARLDIGPSATVSFPLGDTQSRLALDYRWRVAGNAEPKSGPALTISAGF